MLLTIEWRLKTPIYISQERSCNLLMGCWWWDLGREDEESDCQYWQWCQCAAVMEQGWGSSCWPIVSPSPPRPGHDGCHPLGGAQWIAQKTALKSSRSNPGIIDVGIELDCVIIWVTQLLTRLFLIKLLHMFSLSSQVLYTDLFIDGSALNYARHWRKFKCIFLINYDNLIWYTPVSKIFYCNNELTKN